MYGYDKLSTPAVPSGTADRYGGPAAGAATAHSKQTAADIYAEQVRTLYAGVRTAALANSLNAAILVYVLWEITVHRTLLWWLSSIVLVQAARLALAYLYETAPLYRNPGLRAYIQADIGWDRAYLASVATTGLLWGIAGARFFPSQAADYQLALSFIIGGTVAGATAVLAPVLLAFPLYALPALIPLGIRFFLENTPHYTAMGVLTFIFLVVLINVAHIIHKTLASSIALRLDNKELLAALTTKAGNLQQINQLLGARISEQQAAQEQFREQFFFLQQLIDAIPTPVFYKDTNGRYQGCNEALTRFLGIPKDGFIGKTVSDMVSRELAEEHARKDRELLEHGGVQIYESHVRAADGSKRHILFHKSVFRDPLNRIIGIIGTLVDLTERERAAGSLLQAQERLQLALKAGTVGLWSWDIKTNEVYISPSWKSQLGYADEEIQNRYEEFESRIHPDDLDRVRQQNMAFIKNPSSDYKIEFRLRHKDGSYRWIFSRANLFKNVDGEPVWFTGCNIDITDRRQMQELLQTSEERFRLVALATNDVLWDWDLKTDEHWWNDAAGNLFGYDRASEPTVEAWKKRIHPDDKDRVVKGLRAAINDGKTAWSDEYHFCRADGSTAIISDRGHIIRDREGTPVRMIGAMIDTTERKQAEEALRHERDLSRDYLDIAGVMLLVLNVDQTVRLINKKGCEILGCRREEVIGKRWVDHFLPERDRVKLNGLFDELKAGKPLEHVENPVLTKDGRERMISWHNTVLRDASGAITGTLSSGEDITERKRAEAELSQSREMLRLIIDNIPQHVFWKDRSVNYLGCNKLFAQAAGITDANAIIGKSDFDLSWKQTAELYRADDQAVMETGIPKLNFEEPLATPDGSFRFLRTSKVPLLDSAGRVFGVLGIFEDITDLKKAQEQIKLMTSALQATANGVVITDTKGAIQWVNQAFTTLTGYRAEEVIGQNPRVLKSNRHDQRFYQQLWSTINAGDVWHGEVVNKRKDGSLYPEEMTITPIRSLQGAISHFVAIKQDITQRKQMETQASQVERLATLGQLVGSIAHEMKNPLFMLTGRLQLLKERLARQKYDAMPDDLQKIESAATRLTYITERFLALAKPAEARLEPTAVHSVLTQAVELMANELMKNRIVVKTAFAPDLPTIQADPRLLQQAFTNLIMNAMQAMASAHGKGTLTVSAALQDGWIEVRIQDDGPGIPADHRAKLFEPFFTTKTDGQSTGLGLWAVRTMAMALRGTVACETETGKGATFIMRLPAANTGDSSSPAEA